MNLEHIHPDLRGLAVPIEQLQLDPGNARTHDGRNLEAIADSLRAFGFRSPVVVQRRGMIVRAGNGRVMAAKQLGWLHVPALLVDDKPADAKRFALADNRTAELASWDSERLAAVVAELRAEDVNLDALWSDAEVDGILRAAQKDLQAAADDAVADDAADEPLALPAKAVTRRGDLWLLGRHRLVCGDCRDAQVVARVVQQAEPAVPLLLSDPPYCSGGFQEAGKKAGTWGTIAADNLSAEGYVELMRGAVAAAAPQGLYLFTDWRMFATLHKVVESCGVATRGMLVWDKGHGGLGSLWKAQHELILYATRTQQRAHMKGRPAVGNVLAFKRTRNVHHYTEKPVALLERLLEVDSWADRGRCPVLDSFAGSGTTLLAAERQGRSCHAIEIEPRFCDVIVERWQQLTGGKATRETQ